MSALISPQIKKQYFDDDGNPLNGGKLYVYEAGTTTPIASYTTEAADTPNTNPIILNARGETGGIFLNAGSYKFLLTDSDDVTIWTEDNITVRDVGSEIDALTSTVTVLNNSVSTSSAVNRLVSGKSSSNSSRSRFLVPIGSSNQVKILATETELSYIVNGTTYTLGVDLVASGLASPESSNNTALVNNTDLSGASETKNLGEFDSSIPYDTAGSEITSRDGEIAAFKIVGGATEYFIAKIDNSNSRLVHAKRGYFFGTSGDPIERTTISNNDTITLMRLSYLYLTTTGSMLVSYTEPVYSTTEPSAPSDGDMWYDMTNNKWKRFNSTTYEDSNVVFIGECIQDENGNTVAARSADFFEDVSELNTFEFEYKNEISIKTVSRDNSISVGGNRLNFQYAPLEFNIVRDLETNETEAASTYYWPYIKENGDKVFSPHAPFEDKGSLKGLYHPYELWRYPGGKIFNDSSSDLDGLTLENISSSLEVVLKSKSISINYNVVNTDNLLLIDSSGGTKTLTMPSEESVNGREFIIKKTSSDFNAITINDSSASEITKIHTIGETVKIFTDGSSWYIIDRYIPSVTTNYTPPTQGFGTITGVAARYTRQGDRVYIEGSFNAGTVTSAEAQVGLPSGLTVDGLASETLITGKWGRGSSSSDNGGWMIATNGDAFINFSYSGVFGVTAGTPFTVRLANTLVSNSELIKFHFNVKITDWNG